MGLSTKGPITPWKGSWAATVNQRLTPEQAAQVQAQEEAIRFHGLDAHDGGFSREQRKAIAETAAIILARKAARG